MARMFRSASVQDIIFIQIVLAVFKYCAPSRKIEVVFDLPLGAHPILNLVTRVTATPFIKVIGSFAD